MSKKRFVSLLILILGVPILQIILIIVEINSPDSYKTIANYLAYLYIAIEYLIIAILILAEIKNLDEFYIDKFTLLIFVFSTILRTRKGIPGENLLLLLIGFAGLLVIIAWIQNKPTLSRTNLSWAGLGIVAGVIPLFPLFFSELILRKSWLLFPLFHNNLTLTAVAQIIKELSFASVPEEMIFRGFLWGYLKRLGWEDKKIFWSQGLLFWFLHLPRLFIGPFSFLIAIPILTFITSTLVLKSKQLFPAILSHTITNAVSAILNLATF